MLTRLLTSLGAGLVLMAWTAVAPVPVTAQAPASSPKAAPANKKAPGANGSGAATRTGRTWAAPRTPWGDPDLQGNFTTKDEMNTPMERPDEFAGRRIDDVTPQELAAAVAVRQRNAIQAAPFISGSRADPVAIGAPIHWLDHLGAENTRPWLVTDPPDGRIPPQTAEARRGAAAQADARRGRGTADSYIDRSLWDRCISRGAPSMTPGFYGASYQILQTKDYVAIRYEMIHESRLIPIEGRSAGRPHVSRKIRSYFGDATARWEGGTLVVDTTNFNSANSFRGAGESLHLIERFRRTAPNKLELTVTVENPATWGLPWSYSIPLTEDDGQPIFEYACHEGNYGIRNILSGARSDEQRGIVPGNGPVLPPLQEQIE